MKNNRMEIKLGVMVIFLLLGNFIPLEIDLKTRNTPFLTGFILVDKGQENVLNYNQAARRIRVDAVKYGLTNYTPNISPEQMAEFKKDYPLDPDSGEWKRAQEIWSTKGVEGDGIKDTHWLTLPADEAQGQLQKIIDFAQKHKGEYSDIVVIGMGGSSRPGDVVRGVLGPKEGFARVHVMENLDEEDVNGILSKINIAKTLFISISKSGGTAETMALTKIAYDEITKAGIDPAKHFIAITTTSKKESKLIKFLTENNVPSENIFEHPDLVGGRYTIFSVIGMLPAALAGHDAGQILSYARKAMHSEAKYVLGKFMSDMEKDGRLYGRLILPEELKSIGPWIEQLVAESQGKVDLSGKNRGILPILERDFDSSIYTKETFAIRFKIGKSDKNDAFVKQVIDKGVPVWEFSVENKEEALGVLYALEFATGMSGLMMDINPFGQPQVEIAKKNTDAVKAEILKVVKAGKTGKTTQQAYNEKLAEFRQRDINAGYKVDIASGVSLYFGDFMRLEGKNFEKFLRDEGIKDLKSVRPAKLYALIIQYSRLQQGKTYGAMLPYAAESQSRSATWKTSRGVLRQVGMQDLLGIGPLYEHSYRQYFMAGPDKGFFTFIVPTAVGSLKIPGEEIPDFTTGMQNALQALGTQKALTDVGRLSVRIEIEEAVDPAISALKKFFEEAAIDAGIIPDS
jgi:glucose-6-phosphate isomerase